MHNEVTKRIGNGDLEILLRALHPVPSHQDSNCPFIEWMVIDLTHCPGVGEWKCKLQEEKYGDLFYG